MNTLLRSWRGFAAGGPAPADAEHPALSTAALLRHASATAQLGLLLGVIHLFRVEESFGLLRITPVIFFGFLVHGLLPLRYRLPFFLLLSWAAIVAVFHVRAGAALIAIGLGLIGLCHLPVSHRARVGLVVLAGAVLAALRAEWLPSETVLSTLVLPILGSMFMFRIILYLYDLRHEERRATIWERLSYFFLLPNVCFPLFPVVDYRTYRRTYYDDDADRIYQKGLGWILRGVLHLLLYRLVYHHLLPSPTDVAGLGGVVQWMVATYLLYLRISGQFHLIIGILCLFGFNLPETHHLYYLASSFNDFWRRINIYWKDFMMKVVYYPTFMRLRRRGMDAGLVIATLVVFAGTWLLHSYQWFWLQGAFPVRATDGLFWAALGVAVCVNSLVEVRRGRKRTLRPEGWSLRAATARSARTLGLFVFICILWSLWSSSSVGEWWSLVAVAGTSGPEAYALLLLALAGVAALGVLAQWVPEWRTRRARRERPLPLSRPGFAGSFASTGGAALLLLAAGWPGLPEAWPGPVSDLVASLRADELNRDDRERVDRGYYEGLLDDGGYATALWRVRPRPEGWEGIRGSDLIRRTGDVLEYELIPGYDGTFKGSPFRTNRWGLRDREYERAPLPGTRRIALLGASFEFGAGVERDQTFEAVLEDRLNRERPTADGSAYEILNFAVGGYSLLHNVAVAERKMPAFEPGVAFIAIHSTEEIRLMTHLTKLVRAEVEIPYLELRDVLSRAGVRRGMNDRELHRRLEPYLEEIIGWSLREIARTSRRHGIRPVAVYVPTTEEIDRVDPEKHAMLARLAAAADVPILELEGAYLGHDAGSVQLAPWDFHPSALGHRLLGDRLYERMRESPWLFAPESAGPAASGGPTAGPGPSPEGP